MPGASKPKPAGGAAGGANSTAAKRAGRGEKANMPTGDSIAEAVAESLAPKPDQTAAARGAKGADLLRMKGLTDQVAARTGAKKADLKAILEAVLSELGETLARGQGVNLPGLGRIKVARSKPSGSGETITLKLKRGAEKSASPPLAEADD